MAGDKFHEDMYCLDTRKAELLNYPNASQQSAIHCEKTNDEL